MKQFVKDSENPNSNVNPEGEDLCQDIFEPCIESRDSHNNIDLDMVLSDDDVIESDEISINSESDIPVQVPYNDENNKNVIYDSDTESEDEEYLFPATDVHNSFDQDNRIMFQSANLTVSNVLLMIRGFIIRFNSNRDQQIALIDLVKTLAGPQFMTWNYTPYLLSKILAPPSDKLKKHYYCSACNVKLLTVETQKNVSTSITCESCSKTFTISAKSTNYFISIDIKYQLEILLNQPNIQENLKEFYKKQYCPCDDGTIRDVYDCSIYKDIKKNLPGALTFNFNIDGAQLFNSAKKSLWPLQLHLNELTPNVRFKHIILAALWQTEKEPTPAFIDLYLSIFVEEIEYLGSTGINIVDHYTGLVQNKKIVPLFGCVDSVARPLLQNRIKFNGSSGCSYCHHFGVYDSGSMRYPLLDNDPALRSHEDHVKDVQKSIKYGKRINGIKGECILLKVNNFDIIWNLPPDYMHGTLLGVTRQFFHRWNTFNFKKSDREKINERMSNIKLCREIRRSIRRLDLFDKFKATELKTWLIIICLPCLQGILPDDLFYSFSQLVDSIYTLLKDSITESEIKMCEYYLLKFVGESQILYDIKFLTFNLHSLLHYVTAVRRTGPLWATSAFAFENGIYQFMREINAPNGCVKQIADKWLRKSLFQHFLANKVSNLDTAIKYSKSLFIERSPLQNAIKVANSTLIGTGLENVSIEKLFRNFMKDESICIKTYDRCIYKSMYIHSVNYARAQKTNDSVIQTETGEIVQVYYFLSSRNECYFCGRIWVIGDNAFNKKNEAPVARHIFKVSKKKSRYVFYDINTIKQKAVVIDTKDELYVTFIPNVYEIQ